MFTICGKEYDFDVPYNLKCGLLSVYSINNRISTYKKEYKKMGRDVSLSYLPQDFVLDWSTTASRDKTINNILRTLQLEHTPIGIYLKSWLRLETKVTDDKNIEKTFIFREHFHWPAGYFYDGTKCWHSYNQATPRLWEKAGAFWCTVYNKKVPLARFGVYLEKDKDIIAFFNSVGYNFDGHSIPKYFNDGRYEEFYPDLHNYGAKNTPIVLYINGVYGLRPIDSTDNIKIKINEGGFKNKHCTKCGCWYIKAFADEHVCGSNHFVDRVRYDFK